MAKSVQLPNMKVRQRSTKDKRSKFEYVSRGNVSQLLPSSVKKFKESSPDGGSDDWNYSEDFSTADHHDDPMPSLYSVKQRISSDAWEGVRELLRMACVESHILPENQVCVACSSTEANIWCRRCGANAFFCEECWRASHERVNIFHVPEFWENNYFKPVVMTCKINALPEHTCTTKRDVAVRCLDEDGYSHGVAFATCTCEPIAVTMVRAGLWPSTPSNPRFAFSFELLDWYESLLLECQVSLKGFCEALCYKTPHLIMKRRDIYQSMIDSFEEYRFMKNELRTLKFLCSDLDHGNICPACPKESGTAVVSVDALFGLPRKRSAGISYREPLNQELYFLQQTEVDEFIRKQSPADLSVINECNSFLAGDPIRSSSRYSGLDETAVFGCACRHEIPLMFVSLKHGERLGYAVYILQKVLSYYPDLVKIVFMYDIACTLQQHLSKVESEIFLHEDLSLPRLQLAIPIFHAYGHKTECQVKFSPLRCNGLGLSDGEVMERLWSFLRRFSRITKETRPSHRIDILSDALNYYAYKKKQKLHVTLKRRFKMASEKKMHAQECHESLIAKYGLKKEDVMCLVNTSQNPESPTTIPPALSTWKYAYFLDLNLYHSLCDDLNTSSSEDSYRHTEKLKTRLKKVTERLTAKEAKHSISRWKRPSIEYNEFSQLHSSYQKKELKQQIRIAAESRHFLLRQKAKYADGQKIAKKLSKQISKLCTSIRNLLANYNRLCAQTAGETQLTLTDVYDLNSHVWCNDSDQHDTGQSFSLSSDAKHDILQSFFELSRSEEELKLLEMETKCVSDYYQSKISVIDSCIESIKSREHSNYNIGSISLLIRLKWSMELLLHKTRDEQLHEPSSTYADDDDDDDSSDSENSSNEDD